MGEAAHVFAGEIVQEAMEDLCGDGFEVELVASERQEVAVDVVAEEALDFQLKGLVLFEDVDGAGLAFGVDVRPVRHVPHV